MGGSRTGKRRRCGGEVKSVDSKSLDVGDECDRLTLMTLSLKKIFLLFSYPTICVFFFQGIYLVWLDLYTFSGRELNSVDKA